MSRISHFLSEKQRKDDLTIPLIKIWFRGNQRSSFLVKTKLTNRLLTIVRYVLNVSTDSCVLVFRFLLMAYSIPSSLLLSSIYSIDALSDPLLVFTDSVLIYEIIDVMQFCLLHPSHKLDKHCNMLRLS